MTLVERASSQRNNQPIPPSGRTARIARATVALLLRNERVTTRHGDVQGDQPTVSTQPSVRNCPSLTRFAVCCAVTSAATSTGRLVVGGPLPGPAG
jgi:hypothetical protein